MSAFAPTGHAAAASLPSYVPIAPIVVDDVFDDVDAVLDHIAESAPFPSFSAGPTRRISAAQAAVFAERSEGAGDDGDQPIFRVNYDEATYEGSVVWTALNCEKFRKAAQIAFNGSYLGLPLEGAVNIVPPVGAAMAAHTDVPFFLGMEDAPTWLRLLMMRSGLFERWRWPLATGLFWLHRGEGGAFEYWDRGPNRPPRRMHDLNNRCLISDNELMFHRVAPVPRRTPKPMTSAQIRSAYITRDLHDPETWWVSAEGERLWAFPSSDLRFTVLLKTPVFADEKSAAEFCDPARRLDQETVLEIFLRDLAARRIEASVTEESPAQRDAFVRLLSRTYPTPTPVS